MSGESREQILADFQACTGLEDMEECIHVLEQYDWNLLNAVQAVHDRFGDGGGGSNESIVPKHSSSSSSIATAARQTNVRLSPTVKKTNHTSSHKRHSDSDDNDDSDEPRIIKSLPSGQRTSKSTTTASSSASNRGVRELHFKVEYHDRTEKVTAFDTDTVRRLRDIIAEKLHVLATRQNFTNWQHLSYDDRTLLKDLNLPKENIIHLTSIAHPTTNGAARSTTSTVSSRTHPHTTSPSKDSPTAHFPITVLYEDKPGKSVPFDIVLKPTSTIHDIKKEIEHLTHIPIRQQDWTGLLGAKDSDELRHTIIARKAHLVMRPSSTAIRAAGSSSNQQAPSGKHESKHPTPAGEDEQMDVDQDYDMEQFVDDDINSLPHTLSNTTTASSTTAFRREPLIPDRCTDDMAGLEQFTRVFHTRFGSTAPILFIGSLDNAIQESFHSPIQHRRPLAIYLHHDRSVCANVFCTQVLGSETIVEYLASNYVLWAWDVTFDSNKNRLLETLKRCVGNQCAQRVGAMEKDSYPVLLLIMRSRGFLELLNVIEGKSTPTETLSDLMQSYELFEQQRQRDREEDMLRETRENLKRQQEDEYHQSIAADMAKERARQDDERRQQEQQDADKRQQQQRLVQQRECQARLPQEPNETDKDTTRLKIRLPDNEGVLIRRFRIHDPLQILFDYLTSQGRMFGEYKLLSAYPKRDLTTLNRSDTLEQLKLYPQEQLILEAL